VEELPDDAEEIFYQALQLGVRADRASDMGNSAKADELFGLKYVMDMRVLRADPKHVYALHNIGVAFDRGQGVAQDKRQAVLWWRKAGELGLIASQFNLGKCYSEGVGVEKDLQEGVRFYQMAAEHASRSEPQVVQAQHNLGTIYGKGGEGVQQDLGRAVEWYQKAAGQGYAAAQFNLANKYRAGQGVQQDFEQAAGWYRKAAEQGDADAQHNLGYMHYHGEGMQQDKHQAALWLQKAADQGAADGARVMRHWDSLRALRASK
jgi:TPR repeat protein